MTHESPPPDPLTQEAEHRKTIEALKAQAQYYAQLSEQAEAERDALKAENERYHRALADENIAKLQAEATRTSLQGALKAKAEEWRTRGNVLCPIEKTPPKNGWTTKQFMERPLGGILCAHANELDALRASSASGPAHCECRQPDFVALAGKPETTTCVRCQKPPKPEARADEQERSE
jgi:hypothetical protein